MCIHCGFDPETSRVIQTLTVFVGNDVSPHAVGIHSDAGALEDGDFDDMPAESFIEIAIFLGQLADMYASVGATKASRVGGFDAQAVIGDAITGFFDPEESN